MRVLLIANAYSVYTMIFIKNTLLKIENIKEIVVFHSGGVVVEEYSRFYEKINVIVIGGKSEFKDNLENVLYHYNLIKKMGYFDVCHVHFLSYYPVLMGKLVRNNCGTLIAHYWGSDWFRVSGETRGLQAELMRVSDYVISDSLQIIKQLSGYFKKEFDSKINYIRFKLPVIEVLKDMTEEEKMKRKTSFKKQNNISCEKVVITCGYNGGRRQNHLAILAELMKLPENLSEKIVVVLPFTYGKNDKYVSEIKSKLATAKFEYCMLEEYLNFEEVASLRLATDIFINMQISDAYSSTILEYTYCNKIVVNGDWLDYSELEAFGAHYEKIKSISELSELVTDLVMRKDLYQCLAERNLLSIEGFQSEYDKNALWAEIYGSQGLKKEYFSIEELDRILMGAYIHDNKKEQINKMNLEMILSLLEIPSLEKRIRYWIKIKNIKTIAIYGAGIYGKVAYVKLKESIESIYVVDKNERSVSWYEGGILYPEQLKEIMADVVIVTPLQYMTEIKQQYKDLDDTEFIAINDWIAELENINDSIRGW